MTHLTKEDHQTLNNAHALLMAHLGERDYWTFGWRWTKGCDPSFDVTMFTPIYNEQHNWVEGETFADKIETGLAIIAAERASAPTPEESKRRRIDALRAQLERLEGEVI